ncbi:spermidine synthase, partial [Arthrobacter deserti]|nr:spermidine synthase [Arthrobacter deserti]
PRLETARREVATIGEVFEHVAVVADPPMLKGRRYGNVVIARSDRPFGDDPRLARTLLAGAAPARFLLPQEVEKFAAGARTLHDQVPG